MKDCFMVELLIENAILTSIYNQCNNGKKVCDYKCGQKIINDANRVLKLRYCKAQCDVVWDQYYLKQLQNLTRSNNQDQQLKIATPERMKKANERLQNSKKRLAMAKLALQKHLASLPADLSMRVAKPSPAFATN